jgi:hypothetical protein
MQRLEELLMLSATAFGRKCLAISGALKKLSANANGGINDPPDTVAGRATCQLSLFPPGYFC